MRHLGITRAHTRRDRKLWRTGFIALLVTAMLGVAAAPGAANHGGSERPWEQLVTGGIGPGAVGQGFNLNEADLAFILEQILISEAHAATATTGNPCGTLIGTGPNQIPQGANAHLLSLGLRTIDGSCNNLLPGQTDFGAADRPFPRLTTPVYRDADLGTSYTQTAGTVFDAEPRRISNLIVDQTTDNPAAVATWDGVDTDVDAGLVIPNIAPDEGLSAPFNSVFTLFGQFFDHGLDFTTKAGDTVVIPLDSDDPLGAGIPPMMMSRATNTSGEPINQTTPFIDQQQTYASHPSVHVFLREYETSSLTGLTVANGHMLRGPGDGMADWATVKSQAADLLGIQLSDFDVHNAPLLVTDPYGRYVRGTNGYPLMVRTGGGLVEGDPTANGGDGELVPADAARTGHNFLADIAHHANPQTGQVPDTDPGTTDDGDNGTYDDEMLDAHFVAGDGRVNENIGLTAIHHVFHSEHNRLVDHIKDVLLAGDAANLPSWQLDDGPPIVWNGERLLQAARFATEMQYQHLAFEEFARKVQPNVNVFDSYDATIDPAITVEFSQAAYRFGHSMLRAELDRFESTDLNNPSHIPLLEGFLNPPRFFDGTTDPDEAAGSLLRGAAAQEGNEIDGFVLPTLRNSLVGLPLDLAAINIARGRDYGIAPLNEVRRQLFATTGGNPALEPYVSWNDFALAINNPGALNPPPQMVNFIAAYGTHSSITTQSTILDKRAAAEALVAAAIAPGDAADFLNSQGIYVNGPGGVTTTGVDEIDLWMGGLAEKNQVAGGMLGDTLNYIFELQMERLQEGDRFYYLERTAGMNLLTQLEGNSLSEMIERNTSAGNLPADVFSAPNFFFDAGFHGSEPGDPIVDNPETPDYDESLLLTRDPDGTLRFSGGEHVNWAGSDSTTLIDRIASGIGDDTIRGNGGDDRLEGSDGGDQLIGGLGNDIITDALGDEDIKGGDGHDAINAGNGLDLLQGGRGNDYITGSTDPKEVLAGPGNDFIRGGDSADEVHGGDGDDWLEGAEQSDNLEGDSGLPLILGVDINEPGDDVINGDGGNDRHFGEGGNDISILNTGVERIFGQMGFDWATHYNDPLPGTSDLSNNALIVPGVDIVDRFLLTEGLSGWDLDDQLRGDDVDQPGMLGNELTPAGIANISGLAAVLPPGTTTFDTGNIILGGRGSDLLEGGGGDDVIDGDAWLTAQLEAPNVGGPGTRLVDSLVDLRVDLMAGDIHGGQISIVRAIETEACATCEDTAIFSGPIADYDLVYDGNTVTVDHARGDGLSLNPLLDNGTDFLRNIEFLQFLDVTVPFGPLAPENQILMTFTGTTTLPGAGAILDEDIAAYSPSDGTFSVFFDGSDVGLGAGNGNIDGIALLDTDSILMSFVAPRTVPGIPGTVDDSDIVRFDAATLGTDTAGTFSLFFDGSTQGLTTNNEDIDAVELLDTGELLISTTGNPGIPGLAGLADEDLLLFTPAVAGDFSAGTWTQHFDGSDIALNNSGGEEVTGVFVDGLDLALTTLGNFNVPGLTGPNEDIFTCDLFVPGPATACTTISLALDGTLAGIPAAASIDGMELAGPPGPPPTPTVSVADLSLPEGSGGGTTAFDFTVSLSSAPTGPISVQVDTADDTADGTDYTPVVGQLLTWNVGDPLAQTVTVDVNADDDLELAESFFVNLSAVTGADPGDLQAVGTILDDDGVVPPVVSIDDVALAEGSGGGVTPFVFTVSLDVVPTATVSVVVNTADDAATAPVDYATLIPPVTLTWNAGDPVSQTVTVDVNADDEAEATETFFVNLSAPNGLTIGDPQGLGTIIDDDTVAAFLYMSFLANTNVPGVGLTADEDIVSVDPATNVFATVFDGSDVGVTARDIDGFTIIDADTILMSFDTPGTIPGIAGTVDDSDIVEFTATGLGPNTAGSFSLFFDGSLHGLTTNGEDIDAVELLPNGTLLVSTTGNPAVAGVAAVRDEDILAFTPTTAGDYTSGTWSMYLDGTDFGLAAGGEDTNGAFVDGINLGLTTLANFNVPGSNGTNEDIFSCDGLTPGINTICAGSSVLFDGSAAGLPLSASINGISN